MEKKYICPCCNEEVGPEHMACQSGAKGGKAGVGEVKSRGSDAARKAVLVRWARERERKRVVVKDGVVTNGK